MPFTLITHAILMTIITTEDDKNNVRSKVINKTNNVYEIKIFTFINLYEKYALCIKKNERLFGFLQHDILYAIYSY